MFNVNLTGLEGAERIGAFRFAAVAERWAKEFEHPVLDELRKHAPVGKGPGAGQFRDSIRPDRRPTLGGVMLTYTASAPHAKYVIHGTRPHIIQPRNAKALYWQDAGGGSHFARLVHHPGTKPNRFVERAVHPLVPVMSRRLVQLVDQSLKGR